MIRTWITAAIALVLFVLGLSVFYYKAVVHSYPLLPDQNINSWYVEFSAVFDQDTEQLEEGVELTLLKPGDNDKYAVTNTQILAPDFGVEEIEDDQPPYFKVTKRDFDGDETILLRFNVFAITNEDENEETVPEDIPVADDYAADNRLSNPDETTTILYEKIDSIVSEAKERSAGDDDFTRLLIEYINENSDDTDFLMQEMETLSREVVILNLVGVEEITARVANGFAFDDRNDNVDLIRWIEIYQKDDDTWVRIPTTDTDDNDLDNYYRWWTGTRDAIEGSVDVNYDFRLSLKANSDSSLTREIWLDENRAGPLKFLSLQTLSLEQQFVVQILLLFPIGALIVCLGRQVIGIQTFGTFMPMLIALAFRETGLLLGIAFFFGIISLGLIARAWVTKLHLLMVPRLSVVMTIIVIVIILVMLFTKEQDLSLGISVALFPVIIMTMFIERMSTILDEQSPIDAFYGFIGSMFIATVIYLSLMNVYVMHLMFVFPELTLVVMACLLVLGRYNGYKLMEYWRFRQIKSQLEEVN